jgi:hypothetical protein
MLPSQPHRPAFAITKSNRNEEQSLANLDVRGCALVHDYITKYDTRVFTSYNSMRADYVPKVQEWLKALLNAEEVMVTTLTIRKRDPNFPKRTWGTSGDRRPIQGVHIGERLNLFVALRLRQ